jgi:hypothetical protein
VRVAGSIAALLTAAGLAATAAPAAEDAATPTSDSQATFTKLLTDDPATSTAIRRLLTTKAGFVDPRSGFVDVTGDGRKDALVLVTTGGAAGAVALYVLTTHGQSGDHTTLKAALRLQSLHRATLRVAPGTVTVLEPLYRRGDDLSSPNRLRVRSYTFDPKTVSFRRAGEQTTPYG